MEQNISTLRLSKYIIKKLNEQGIIYCNDLLNNLDTINLSSEIKNELRQVTRSPSIKSALQLVEEENKLAKIPTFCKELDNVLQGGIHLQHITEFCGAPGSGKTQFALQLCVDVQIPSEFGGLQSEAIFIGTNSGYTSKRLLEIASACVSHCNGIADYSKSSALKETAKKFTVENILAQIHYIEVDDHIQLIAVMEKLKQIVLQKQIKLIVIDSLSFIFRYGVPMLLRTQLLYKIITDLQNLSTQCNLAVVVTNEITTRPFGGYDGLVPALGESYAHMIPTRILLGTGSSKEHVALIDKSTSIPKVFVPFQISEEGIRDYNIKTKSI